MPTYILRTIDPSLWETVKARAAVDGLPLRRIILALLKLYGQGKIDVSTTATPS